jgi:hypothetical protein
VNNCYRDYCNAVAVAAASGSSNFALISFRKAGWWDRRIAHVSVARVPSEPFLLPAADGFAVWADECVRNESKSASSPGALRSLIASEIRRLRPSRDQVLHAAFAGQRWRGTDVENLVFNNIDQTLSLFQIAARAGVRFEDLGEQAPPAPDGANRLAYFSYRLADRSAAFTAVGCDRLVCRVSDVVVPEGTARMAARVWLVVRRAREHVTTAPLASRPYILRVGIHGLSPATSVKAVVDGVSGAMQRAAPTDQLRACVRRLAVLLEVPSEELLALATGGPEAPLAEARRLFTLDGETQVRVTPDDDRCAAAEVLSVSEDEPVRVAVEVYAARRHASGFAPLREDDDVVHVDRVRSID